MAGYRLRAIARSRPAMTRPAATPEAAPIWRRRAKTVRAKIHHAEMAADFLPHSNVRGMLAKPLQSKLIEDYVIRAIRWGREVRQEFPTVTDAVPA